MIDRVAYSPGKLNQLQKHIRYQGGYYRELNKVREQQTFLDILGKNPVFRLTRHIPESIQYTNQLIPTSQLKWDYRKSYRNWGPAARISLKDQGKKQQYAEYLNSGSAAKPWETEEDNKLPLSKGQILKRSRYSRATGSVGYVIGALEKRFNIDVVTTEEVYGHLVMSGVSEGIINGIRCFTRSVPRGAVEGDNIDMDFLHVNNPSLTKTSLTLYRKHVQQVIAAVRHTFRF